MSLAMSTRVASPIGALLSALPFRPVRPKEISASRRLALGCVEVNSLMGHESAGRALKLLVGSIYGHASDHEARDRLILASLSFLHSVGLPWALGVVGRFQHYGGVGGCAGDLPVELWPRARAEL